MLKDMIKAVRDWANDKFVKTTDPVNAGGSDVANKVWQTDDEGKPSWQTSAAGAEPDDATIQLNDANKLSVPQLKRVFNATIEIVNSTTINLHLPILIDPTFGYIDNGGEAEVTPLSDSNISTTDMSEYLQEGDIFFCTISNPNALSCQVYNCYLYDKNGEQYEIMGNYVSKYFTYDTMNVWNTDTGNHPYISYLSYGPKFTILNITDFNDAGDLTICDLISEYKSYNFLAKGIIYYSYNNIKYSTYFSYPYVYGYKVSTDYNSPTMYSAYYINSKFGDYFNLVYHSANIGTSSVTVTLKDYTYYIMLVVSRKTSTDAYYGSNLVLLMTSDSSTGLNGPNIYVSTNSAMSLTKGNSQITLKSSSSTYYLQVCIYQLY